jgi:hypothetical protein
MVTGEVLSAVLQRKEILPVLVQVVNRAVPPTTRVEPGPGLDGTNPLPLTSSVKPLAAPAYTLNGRIVTMFKAFETLTAATPDSVRPGLDELITEIETGFDDGMARGARKSAKVAVPDTSA